MKSESILCVETSSLQDWIGDARKRAILPADEAPRWLATVDYWYGPRQRLEDEPSFRQVIPYVVLANSGRVLSYTRSASSNEPRLHQKVSVGFGGHVSLGDCVLAAERIDGLGTIAAAAEREVREELDGVVLSRSSYLGVVALSETPVDRVHLGVFYFWEVASQEVRAREDSICELRWIDPNMSVGGHIMETWSMVATELLSGRGLDPVAWRQHAGQADGMSNVG